MNEIEELKENFVPSREKIEALQKAMTAMPQIELKTEHFYSGGMYARKVSRPAGTLIVGKVHKKDHIFVCTSGEIIAWTESGMRTLKAGDVVESKAGTKRVTLALVDSIGMTVHKTDKVDLDEIEQELIEEDKTAMFDSSNRIIEKLSDIVEIGE